MQLSSKLLYFFCFNYIKSEMKIAFVNCWTMPGGVLKVLESLVQKSLKEASNEVEILLFTMISDVKELKIEIP